MAFPPADPQPPVSDYDPRGVDPRFPVLDPATLVHAPVDVEVGGLGDEPPLPPLPAYDFVQALGLEQPSTWLPGLPGLQPQREPEPEPAPEDDPNTVGTFVRHAAQQANPLQLGQMLPFPKALGGSGWDHPLNPQRILDGMHAVREEGHARLAQGDYVGAAAKYLESIVPVLGPMMSHQGNQLEAGQYAAAAGDVAGMGLAEVAPHALGAVPAVAAVLPKRVKATVVPPIYEPVAAPGRGALMRAAVAKRFPLFARALEKYGQKADEVAPPVVEPPSGLVTPSGAPVESLQHADVFARAKALYLERGGGQSPVRMARALKDAGYSFGALRTAAEKGAANALVERLMGESASAGRSGLVDPLGVPVEESGNLAYAPAARSERGHLIVSGAMPWAKDVIKSRAEDRSPLRVDLGLVERAPVAMEKMAAELSTYPIVRPAEVAGKTARQVLGLVSQRITDNLHWLYDKTPEWIRNLSKQWYEGAHRRSLEDASLVRVTPEQMSAVIARLSPQKDWFQNAELGRRLSYTWRDLTTHNPTFTKDVFEQYRQQILSAVDEDVAKAATGVRTRLLNEVLAGRKVTDIPKEQLAQWKLQIRQDATGEIARVQAETRARVTAAKKRMLAEERRLYQDKTFHELPLEGKARMIRAISEATDPTTYPMLLPTGEVGGLVLNTDGRPAKLGWGLPNAFIEDAISVLEDGSWANISRRLGDMHKVRAFFNNINDPWYEHSTTIDTHAVAAGLLQPLSQKADEVNYTMGGVDGARVGLSGSNPVYQHAYTVAAHERGVLPREMQSVTWESLRGLFSASQKKDAALLKGARDLWAQHQAGTLSAPEVREAILELVGGKIKEPAWIGHYEERRPR